MPKGTRVRPKHLAAKLLAIRKQLSLSQSQIAKALELKVSYARVSEYENDQKEPSLPLLLRYARLAGICTCVLIDDDLSLSSDVSHSSKKKTSQKKK